MVEIRVIFARIRKGAHYIYIDHARLPYYLNLRQSDMTDLREARFVR
jgi:hypothetical protein